MIFDVYDIIIFTIYNAIDRVWYTSTRRMSRLYSLPDCFRAGSARRKQRKLPNEFWTQYTRQISLNAMYNNTNDMTCTLSRYYCTTSRNPRRVENWHFLLRHTQQDTTICRVTLWQLLLLALIHHLLFNRQRYSAVLLWINMICAWWMDEDSALRCVFKVRGKRHTLTSSENSHPAL